MWQYGDPSVEITKDTTDAPPAKVLIECGNGSFNMGSNPDTIDWVRFYEILEEQYGFDMQDLEGKVDNRIRRIVRKAVSEGEIN